MDLWYRPYRAQVSDACVHDARLWCRRLHDSLTASQMLTTRELEQQEDGLQDDAGSDREPAHEVGGLGFRVSGASSVAGLQGVGCRHGQL